MTFIAPLRALFVKPFPSQVSAATSWWLSGGIAAANCVFAYAPKGAASQAASYTNLNNPGTYNATAPVAPTWDSTNGWIFNGSSQYLSIPSVASIGFGTWSAFIKYTTLTGSGDRTLFGVYYDSGNNNFLVQATNNGHISYNARSSATNTPVLTSGTYGIAGKTPYRNTSAESNVIPAGSGTNTYSIFIGALNVVGSPTQYTPFYVQAFAIYNITLNGTQVSALANAMNAL